jgi:hypothetical protein
MFVLLGYTGNAGAGAVNFDLTALPDADFSQRNGHYVFTEPYQLLGATNVGANDILADLLCPTWNAIGKMNVFPSLETAAFSSAAYLDLRADVPPKLPLNEEFQFQTSNNAGVAVRSNGFVILGTADWNRNLPQGILPILVHGTASVTGVGNSWSGPFPVVFEQSLRGGVYSIVGADAVIAGGIAFRIVFPRQKLYSGRKLRPGNGLLGGVGNTPPLNGQLQSRYWGEWGRFHTFEPPQIELWMNAGGAVTVNWWWQLIYLGTDLSLLEASAMTI